MKTPKESLKNELDQLFRCMDFVSRHPSLDDDNKEAERMADVYQQLGTLWEFLALQCPHTDGWRKTGEGQMVCKVCGTVRDADERWHLLPRKGRKVIGRRVTPSSKKTFPNKKAAAIVEDSIQFHGTKLTVDVHNAYRWEPFRDSKHDIAIAAERTVDVEEAGMKCSFSEYQVRLRLKKHRRGERPPSGAFVFELPKRLLEKLPLLIELDENDELVGVDVFRPANERKVSRHRSSRSASD